MDLVFPRCTVSMVVEEEQSGRGHVGLAFEIPAFENVLSKDPAELGKVEETHC